MYKCNNCGYTNKKWFGLCPNCSEGIGELDDSVENSTKNKRTSKQNKDTVLDSSVLDEIKDLTSTGEDIEYTTIQNTPFEELDKIFSNTGGLLTSQVVLLSADAGVGKSTLMTQMCNENSLYISTEETFAQVRNRFERVNPDSKCKILSTVDKDKILSAIEFDDSKFVVIDSINSIGNGSYSYAKTAQITQELINIVKENNKCAIFISQVGRSKEFIGFNSILHAVDTHISMSRSTVSNNIFLVSNKNRFGNVGDIILLHHEHKGLELSEQESMDPTIGTSCFYMYSGTKKIPFNVQCLMSETEDKPIRKCVGIKNNQSIFIWNAILSVNDRKYNTRNFDIFLQTSNGIPLEDGNDVACLNAMLSMYYKKALSTVKPEDLTGSCNLNGNITGNRRFNHISELISLYRN